MMHTGIGVIMGLTTFSLMMLCLVLAFVPASTHHALVAVMQQRGMKLREFLRGKNPPAPALPDHVVQKTREKYIQAFRQLSGKELEL